MWYTKSEGCVLVASLQGGREGLGLCIGGLPLRATKQSEGWERSSGRVKSCCRWEHKIYICEN
jgi:hypothetical protein